MSVCVYVQAIFVQATESALPSLIAHQKVPNTKEKRRDKRLEEGLCTHTDTSKMADEARRRWRLTTTIRREEEMLLLVNSKREVIAGDSKKR